MLTPTALAELRGHLGERLSTSDTELQRHGRDESYHPVTPPEAVVYPESTEEVARIARTCHEHGVPMIPFGVGTSLEGHIAAVDGGVCIDLSGMSLNETKFLSDIPLPTGVTIPELSHRNAPVVCSTTHDCASCHARGSSITGFMLASSLMLASSRSCVAWLCATRPSIHSGTNNGRS